LGHHKKAHGSLLSGHRGNRQIHSRLLDRRRAAATDGSIPEAHKGRFDRCTGHIDRQSPPAVLPYVHVSVVFADLIGQQKG